MKRGCWQLVEDDSGEAEPGTYSLLDGNVWQCEIKSENLGDLAALFGWARRREDAKARARAAERVRR